MLPTDKSSYLGICIKEMSDVKIGELRIFSSPMLMSLEYWEPQHLYATVSQEVEPIKEGDYTIFRNKVIELTADDIHPSMIERCKGKIIANTDPKLINSQWKSHYTAEESFDIARLQLSFLKEYVANPSGEWEVEYEKCNYDDWFNNGGSPLPIKLKLNQDNTVNITAVEQKVYSGEEVEILLKNISMESYIHGLKIGSGQEVINRGSWNAIDWIKENL